jgi:hypothetical protein
MVSIYIVTHILVFCKGADLIMLCFYLFLHCPLDLPQQHLGNIAGCCPQDGNGFYGIEIHYAPEVIKGQVIIRVDAAAGQEHVSYGISDSIPEDNLHVMLVQFFKKAAFLAIHQVG